MSHEESPSQRGAVLLRLSPFFPKLLHLRLTQARAFFDDVETRSGVVKGLQRIELTFTSAEANRWRLSLPMVVSARLSIPCPTCNSELQTVLPTTTHTHFRGYPHLIPSNSEVYCSPCGVKNNRLPQGSYLIPRSLSLTPEAPLEAWLMCILERGEKNVLENLLTSLTLAHEINALVAHWELLRQDSKQMSKLYEVVRELEV